MLRGIIMVIALQLAAAAPAYAQLELSFYGGIQGAAPSNVSGTDPGGIGAFDFQAEWEGRSLTGPIYYGLRMTWWQNESFGWGVDFSHDKVSASDATLAANGLGRLEFTHGLNILTVNAFKRWPNTGTNFTPYVGAGVGVTLPHVEFDSGAGTTFEYQIGGPAVTFIAGASYPINDRWSMFGEYKGSYSVNTVELVSGGSLSTNIRTNAFNLGVSLGF